MNTIIFFCLRNIELWLAIDRFYYTAVHIFDSKLVENAFTRCRVPFRGFRVFSCPLYLEYHRTAVSEVPKGKSEA